MSKYQVVNPATGQVEQEFPTATDAEVQDALERSHAAYGAWRTTAKDERTKILLRVAELYDERIDELALIIAREMGKPLREGKGEVSWSPRSTATTRRRALSSSPTPRCTRSVAARRWSARSRSARCSGSCRGTSRTTRWPGSRRRT